MCQSDLVMAVKTAAAHCHPHRGTAGPCAGPAGVGWRGPCYPWALHTSPAQQLQRTVTLLLHTMRKDRGERNGKRLAADELCSHQLRNSQLKIADAEVSLSLQMLWLGATWRARTILRHSAWQDMTDARQGLNSSSTIYHDRQDASLLDRCRHGRDVKIHS